MLKARKHSARLTSHDPKPSLIAGCGTYSLFGKRDGAHPPLACRNQLLNIAHLSRRSGTVLLHREAASAPDAQSWQE